MIRKTDGENLADIFIEMTSSGKLNADPQQLKQFQDTLKIKTVSPKLVLPKSKATSKLRAINEKIREVDPQKEIVYKPLKVQEPIVFDTIDVALYDPDTIAFLTKINKSDKLFTENYFYNIPDYKPFINLVDTTKTGQSDEIAVSKEIKTEKAGELKQTGIIYNNKDVGFGESFRADWIPVLLIVLFLFIAWTRVFYNKVLKRTVRSSYNALIANRLFREKNTLTMWGGFVLNILFFLAGGFFIFLAMTYYGYHIKNLSGFMVFVISLATLLTFFLLKILVIRLIGFIFRENSGASEYIHNIFIFNKTFGVFILLFVMAIPYIPEPGKAILINAGIAFNILLYLSSVFRGIRLGIKINVSIYYMILYLCTLEFFPLLILYKLFNNYTG